MALCAWECVIDSINLDEDEIWARMIEIETGEESEGIFMPHHFDHFPQPLLLGMIFELEVWEEKPHVRITRRIPDPDAGSAADELVALLKKLRDDVD